MYADVVTRHIAQVDEWLRRIPDKAGSFAIVYHGDCDGVVSGTLFDYILRLTMGKTGVHHIPVRTEQYDLAHVLAALNNIRPDATIFLDLSVQNLPDKLQQAADATGHSLLIYDHHTQYNDVLPARTLYLNPSVTPDGHDENSPPPCYFAAQLAEKRTGINYDWAAAVGLIAESAVDRFLPLFQTLSQKFPALCPIGGIVSSADVQRSKFREISYAVGSAYWATPGQFEPIAFRTLARMIEVGSPASFFDRGNEDSRTLMELEKLVRREISRVSMQAMAEAYHATEVSLRYAEISSEYRIGGVVATRLSRKYRNDLIVIGQNYHGRYVVEARRGPRQTVNVANLLRHATREIDPMSVGGHPAAAGATLPEASSSQFFLALEATAREMGVLASPPPPPLP